MPVPTSIAVRLYDEFIGALETIQSNPIDTTDGQTGHLWGEHPGLTNGTGATSGAGTYIARSGNPVANIPTSTDYDFAADENVLLEWEMEVKTAPAGADIGVVCSMNRQAAYSGLLVRYLVDSQTIECAYWIGGAYSSVWTGPLAADVGTGRHYLFQLLRGPGGVRLWVDGDERFTLDIPEVPVGGAVGLWSRGGAVLADGTTGLHIHYLKAGLSDTAIEGAPISITRVNPGVPVEVTTADSATWPAVPVFPKSTIYWLQGFLLPEWTALHGKAWTFFASTDHDTSVGGLYWCAGDAPDLSDASAWTLIYDSSSSPTGNRQAETPFPLYFADDAAGRPFRVYFQEARPAGVVGQDSLMVRTADPINGPWELVPCTGSFVADSDPDGDQHRGYARIVDLGNGTLGATHLLRGGADSLCGYSTSVDGIDWALQHELDYRSMVPSSRKLNPPSLNRLSVGGVPYAMLMDVTADSSGTALGTDGRVALASLPSPDVLAGPVHTLLSPRTDLSEQENMRFVGAASDEAGTLHIWYTTADATTSAHRVFYATASGVDAPGNSAPSITLLSPADGAVITQGAATNAQATASDTEDGSLTAQIQWTSSRDGAIGTGGTVSLSGLSVGAHTLTASATDSGGLTGSASVDVTVEAAAVAPTVSIDQGASASLIVGDTLQLSVTTTGSPAPSVTYQSDDPTVATVSGGLVTTHAAGSATITATASNSAGDASDSIALSVQAPNAAPSVQITAPANNTTFRRGDAVSATATATDTEDGDLSDQIVWTSSKDGALATGASLSLADLSVGTHTLTATATDSDNASTSASITVVVEAANTAPTVAITPPGSTTLTVGDTLQLTAGVADDYDEPPPVETWSSSNPAVATVGANTGLVTAVAAGAVTITARATDSDGLTGSDTLALTIQAPANHPPATPTVISATVTAGILTLTGSAFSDPDGNAHAASQWQVQRAGGDWSAPLFDSGQDAQHRTVLTVDVSAWAPGDYVARVRYLDDGA